MGELVPAASFIFSAAGTSFSVPAKRLDASSTKFANGTGRSRSGYGKRSPCPTTSAIAQQRLSAHRHADRFAPLADAVIADGVNGTVGPFHRRGRKGLAVGVTGCGVDGEKDEALAAIDFEFELVEAD